jgi:acyl-CoA hydrolase
VTEEVGDAAELDLTRYIRPGALVAWGQGGIRCFAGISTTAAVRPECCDYLSFSSYTAAGANRALSEAGLLDIVPCHYSQLPDILGAGPLRADVLFLSLPPARPDGTFGLGLAADYLAPLIGRVGTLIAEVNDQVPDTGSDRRLGRGEIDVLVHTSRPPVEYPPKPASDVDKAIAEHVAGLVPDGATLQVGIGSLPAVVLRHLRGHRDLGVHSGMITDEIAELIEAGVITGTRKSTDRGGIPVLALPSTAGTASRIVVRLNGPAGLARADAGVIVTEYGVADLRGLSLARRRERMIAIAHPDHRAALDRTEDKT